MFEPSPKIRCYSINEILAEKSRALFERKGRARDIYDVVNISRNFRKMINPEQVRVIAHAKFEFKKLPAPTVEGVLKAIDKDVLRSNWEHQLAHQINNLPPVESFLADLKEAITWWLDPQKARPPAVPIPGVKGRVLPRHYFPSVGHAKSNGITETIRRAAQSRQCVLISHHGQERLVEPYSLRHDSEGSEILYVREIGQNGPLSNEQNIPVTYKAHEIESVSISNQTFIPRWEVEL